jgi:hypothetical protein
MARSLITFPIRLGLRGANMAVDGATTVAGHALGMAGRLAEVLTKDGGPDLDIDGREHQPEEPREQERPARDRDEPRRERKPSPAPVRPAQAAAPESEPQGALSDEDTPDHVSEEPTLVDEVAEAGAEDGAGAQVHVDEPWENYGELSAEDVIDRITGASTAELAAVQLYEQSHRRRKTVLEAVERELQRPPQ